jgi:hydroxymethylpyrimidine/phosphomethylpyrimidine kinase
MKVASAQTEAVLAIPGLLIQLTTQVRLLTEALHAVNRVVAHVDEMLTDIEPGLKKLGQVLENPVIETIPDTIRDIQENVVPVMLKLRDTSNRLSALAESGARLPGASLITGRNRRDVPS